MNVKVVSSQENFSKIEALIENMNKAENANSSFRNNNVSTISDQESPFSLMKTHKLCISRIANLNK